MNKIIEKFGKVVGNCAGTSPGRALDLLKAGYMASSVQMKMMPDKRLLPHQRYVALLNNRSIRQPLCRPERSAVVNLFFPCGLLHAMGIAPQFTEGLAGYLNGAGTEQAFIDYAEKAGIPQTYCSYHKILLGAVLSDVLPPPRFVANTSLACDANMSTFRTIAEHYGVPHFVVDVPGVRNEETVSYVSEQLREIASSIGQTMGGSLSVERLGEVIRRTNRSLKLYREHLKLLADRFVPNDLTSEMYKVFPTHVLLGTKGAERYFSLLLEDTRAAARSRGEKRILWVHTIPFWQDSIRNLLNFGDHIQILNCDLNFDSMEELDEARPYESMAGRLLSNMLNGRVENRAEGLLKMARFLKADGVVVFCHWGCRQTLGGSGLISELLEREGFPVLLLDGDGCDRKNINEGQMKTKLEAFLEMLEGKS